MDRINELGIEPGVYKSNTGLYVVTEIVTHQFDSAEALPQPLVVFRDLQMVYGRVGGRKVGIHQRYVLPLDKFRRKFEFVK